MRFSLNENIICPTQNIVTNEKIAILSYSKYPYVFILLNIKKSLQVTTILLFIGSVQT